MNRWMRRFHQNTRRRLLIELRGVLLEHERGIEEAYVLQQKHQSNANFYAQKVDWLAKVIAGQREHLAQIEQDDFTNPRTIP